jgi:ribonucleoside-diphosphate reductase alpha chain
MTARERLPNRRAAVTHDLVVGAASYSATLGFDRAGRPREVFLSGAKSGSDMGAVLADVGVAISVALQCGVMAAAMAASVGCAGIPPEPISVIGAALRLIASYEGAVDVDGDSL